ncbi:MAG: formyltransferase family protein [Pseudomonadota bacterium]
MWNGRYYFVGDGLHLLAFMLQQGLSVVGARVPSASVNDVRQAYDIPHLGAWQDKATLVRDLQDADFDVLISCGNPFLLPISELDTNRSKFVNVHPSYLPLLRGPYPLSGALLYGDGAGASLHHMTDVVDGGPLIARVSREIGPDMDWSLLHHLISDAILEAFTLAFHRAFDPDPALVQIGPGSEFRIKRQDLELDLGASPEQIVSRIRAFGQPTLGTRFTYNGTPYVVYRADFFRHASLARMHESSDDGDVVSVSGSTVVLKKDDGFLRLYDVRPLDEAPPSLPIPPGARIGT